MKIIKFKPIAAYLKKQMVKLLSGNLNTLWRMML